MQKKSERVIQDVNPWLTEKEVSSITGLSVSTLQKHRFTRKGMNYSKIGRSVRYQMSDVLDFMTAHKVSVN